MAQRSPRQANPQAKKRPGRPPLPSPVASHQSAEAYLAASPLAGQLLTSLRRAWERERDRIYRPLTAAQRRAEWRTVGRACRVLSPIFKVWREETSIYQAEWQQTLFELEDKMEMMAAMAWAIRDARMSAAEKALANPKPPLRLAVEVARFEMEEGKRVRVRDLAAFAICVGVAEPAGNDQDDQRRCLNTWEKTWKIARAFARERLR